MPPPESSSSSSLELAAEPPRATRAHPTQPTNLHNCFLPNATALSSLDFPQIQPDHHSPSIPITGQPAGRLRDTSQATKRETMQLEKNNFLLITDVTGHPNFVESLFIIIHNRR
ncbi:hypothetical protein Drorol1_Dr00018856 [Drosera rotundifolia]